jgi:hypothetical protein
MCYSIWEPTTTAESNFRLMHLNEIIAGLLAVHDDVAYIRHLRPDGGYHFTGTLDRQPRLSCWERIRPEGVPLPTFHQPLQCEVHWSSD